MGLLLFLFLVLIGVVAWEAVVAQHRRDLGAKIDRLQQEIDALKRPGNPPT